MPLRRLTITAVLALAALTTTGCVSLPGAPGRPANPTGTAPSAAVLDPAGPASPSALLAWPTPTQGPGRQALASTVPKASEATPTKAKAPNRANLRRGRAAPPAVGPRRPAPPRSWAPARGRLFSRRPRESAALLLSLVGSSRRPLRRCAGSAASPTASPPSSSPGTAATATVTELACPGRAPSRSARSAE